MGAPAAVQVADRFHLVHNISDALKELLRSRRWEAPAPTIEAEVAPSVPPAALPGHVSPDREPEPTPRKRALWEEVQKRKDVGQSHSAMARELGVNRKTIGKYLRIEQPPAYGPRPKRGTKLTPYLPYLRQRWEEGCHNARWLHRELLARGYSGAETRVKEVVRPWRREAPPQLQRNRSSSDFYWLVLQPSRRLTDRDQPELARILEANPILAQGYHLKESFQHLVARRDVKGLDSWIETAGQSPLPSFQSLARSFRQDYAAVRLALTTPWSTGQCEGQICRAKLIKRLGYGRAKLDLLRQRILHRFAA